MEYKLLTHTDVLPKQKANLSKESLKDESRFEINKACSINLLIKFIEIHANSQDDNSQKMILDYCMTLRTLLNVRNARQLRKFWKNHHHDYFAA